MTPAELVAAREALGIGQAELARLLGVAQATTWRWEHGQRSVPPYIALAIRGIACERKHARRKLTAP